MAKIVLIQNKHASKPPSGAFQWSGCPGSLTLENTLPEDDRNSSSFYAQLGTATHDLVERALNEGKHPIDYKGRLIEVIENTEGEGTSMLKANAKLPKDKSRIIFEVDADMIQGASRCTDYVRQCMVDRDLTDDDMKAERRTQALPERDDCYGTVDVTIDSWPDLLEVVDYKNGGGVVVEVKGNKQTRLYLLGVALETDFSHERYRHTICQPNAPHADGAIRSEDITAAELQDFHEEMLAAAAEVDEAQAAFKGDVNDEWWVNEYLDPGENGGHCRWCAAVPFCPAVKAKVQEIAANDFDDDPEDLHVPVEPEEIGQLLPWVPFIDNWLKALEAHGQRYLEAGGDSARIGQKLVRKQSSGRKWQAKLIENEKKMVAAIAKKFKLTKDALYTIPKLITGPQAEKLIATDDKKAFNEGFLFKPEGGITMAPLDDPRDEISMDPVSDFEDEDL
jgi:hypothetical protein